MTPKVLRNSTAKWIWLLAAVAAGYACSKEGDSGAEGASSGASCQAAADCKSGVCNAGICYGSGQLAPAKSPCESSSQCASGTCAAGICAPGTALPNGLSCAAATECKSGLCTSGVCGSASSSGSGGTSSGSGTNQGGGFGVVTSANPPFLGLGDNWRPLTPGCGPDTAKQCAGACEAAPNSTATVIRPPALLCFGADDTQSLLDPTPDTPAAIIEQVIETLNGQSYVHIRVTFDPAFADNTFGANASAGWFATSDGKTGKGHTFVSDLTGSDHLQLQLTDATGATVMTFKEDYITSLTATTKPPKGGPAGTGGATSTTTTASTSVSGCGYTSLGVLGGDGAMLTGDSSDILAVATSIERNVGGCGYCASSACSAGTTGTGDGDCAVNSPLTDENYTPNALTPNWNYNVVYEVWVKLSAFGTSGFGQAYITSVHASPSKLSGNTLLVVPEPCPPGWGTCAAGQNCAFAPPPGSGGSGGGGGTTGTGEEPCKPNYQMYITQEGGTECTPIPFAGYPGMAGCPTGYHLDTASEGQFCLRD